MYSVYTYLPPSLLSPLFLITLPSFSIFSLSLSLPCSLSSYSRFLFLILSFTHYFLNFNIMLMLTFFFSLPYRIFFLLLLLCCISFTASLSYGRHKQSTLLGTISCPCMYYHDAQLKNLKRIKIILFTVYKIK